MKLDEGQNMLCDQRFTVSLVCINYVSNMRTSILVFDINLKLDHVKNNLIGPIQCNKDITII